MRNDTQFLSEAGNIDYSLLVGVDGAHISSWTVPKKSAILILSSPHADEKKELVVGLIDTLGVFNTLKMLENVGKTALKKATSSDTETVTILPPSDYASRFRQGECLKSRLRFSARLLIETHIFYPQPWVDTSWRYRRSSLDHPEQSLIQTHDFHLFCNLFVSTRLMCLLCIPFHITVFAYLLQLSSAPYLLRFP